MEDKYFIILWWPLHTSAWIGHRHTCDPSHFPPHPIPPGCHRATALSSLHHTSNSHCLPILMYIFQCIQCNPYQTTNSIFYRNRINNFTICMETQKIPNSQSNLERKEWNWRNQPAWLQTILKSYTHQDSMVLAQSQKYRLMEQNRNLRDKSMHLWTNCLWQRRQKYKIEKRKSL